MKAAPKSLLQVLDEELRLRNDTPKTIKTYKKGINAAIIRPCYGKRGMDAIHGVRRNSA